MGYAVIEAENGIKALEYLENTNPGFDILVTDLIMPEMNGKELSMIVKKKDPMTKVLYTSGYTDNHIVNSGELEEGVNFLNKPYSVISLAKKIREILDQK